MAVLEYERDFYVHTVLKGNHDYIRPAGVLDIFQDIASDHAALIGVGYEAMLAKKYLWVVNYIEFEINDIKTITRDIKVKTWPHAKNRLEFPREFEFINKVGKTVVNGISSWFIVSEDEHKIMRADDVLFGGEFKAETHYPAFRRGKLNRPEGNPVKEFDYQVRPTDLDHNGHLNNARYLDIIYNMFDTNYNYIFNSCEIAFHHEALQNEIIHVIHYKDDIYDCFIGYVNNELSFEVKMILKENCNE